MNKIVIYAIIAFNFVLVYLVKLAYLAAMATPKRQAMSFYDNFFDWVSPFRTIFYGPFNEWYILLNIFVLLVAVDLIFFKKNMIWRYSCLVLSFYFVVLACFVRLPYSAL